MNLKELKELIELVSQKEFAEFEVERQGFRLRISRFRDRDSSYAAPTMPVIVASSLQIPGELPEAVKRGAESSREHQIVPRPTAPEEPAALHVIKSPIVGTFFRAASPQAKAFVEIGSRVAPETVVCIIEAMKLMNEIQAEVTGIVEEIYVQNAQAVEYGQPLFGIKN